MEWTARQLAKVDFAFLHGLEERKTKIMKNLGLVWKPPFFQSGDRVCFVYGLGEGDFGFGKIISDDEVGVDILSDEGKEFRVSPFALIKL